MLYDVHVIETRLTRLSFLFFHYVTEIGQRLGCKKKIDKSLKKMRIKLYILIRKILKILVFFIFIFFRFFIYYFFGGV